MEEMKSSVQSNAPAKADHSQAGTYTCIHTNVVTHGCMHAHYLTKASYGANSYLVVFSF